MKPLVYVAGPYAAPDPVLNVRAAIEAAEILLVLGVTPLVPHLSMLWHLASPRPVEEWYALDLDLLDHCDALVRLPGESPGADREVEHAQRAGIPVFSWVEGSRHEIADWAALL